MGLIRKTIQSKAEFDIEKLDPLKNHVSKAFIPAFFVAADEDTFVNPNHTKKLYEAYAGDKNIVTKFDINLIEYCARRS